MRLWRMVLRGWRLGLRRKKVDLGVLLECIGQIRESQVNIRIAVEKIKRNFTQPGVIETLCVTECELCKIEQTLKVLKSEGF